MKLALIEIKQILVRTLLKYDVNSSYGPQDHKLEFLDDFVLRKPKSNIRVRFTRRKEI